MWGDNGFFFLIELILVLGSCCLVSCVMCREALELRVPGIRLMKSRSQFCCREPERRKARSQCGGTIHTARRQLGGWLDLVMDINLPDALFMISLYQAV